MRRICDEAENALKTEEAPPTRPMDCPLGVPDRPDVDPGLPRQLLLGQAQTKPCSPDPAREPVLLRDESDPEDGFDRRPAGGQGLREVPLPPGHALVPAA